MSKDDGKILQYSNDDFEIKWVDGIPVEVNLKLGRRIAIHICDLSGKALKNRIFDYINGRRDILYRDRYLIHPVLRMYLFVFDDGYNIVNNLHVIALHLRGRNYRRIYALEFYV